MPALLRQRNHAAHAFEQFVAPDHRQRVVVALRGFLAAREVARERDIAAAHRDGVETILDELEGMIVALETADLDAFFASVEQRDDARLRGRVGAGSATFDSATLFAQTDRPPHKRRARFE